MEASTSASRTSDEPSAGSRERDESRSGRMEDRDRDERSGRSRRDDDYDRRDGSRRRDDDRYDARRRHHDDRDRRSDNYDRNRNRDRDRDSSRRDHRQERRSSPGGRERDSGRDWERERDRDYRRDAVRPRNGEDDRRQGGYGDTDRSRNRDADRERRRRDSRSPPPQDGRDGRNGATSRSNDEGAATGAHGLPPLVTEEPTSARVQQFVPPTRESILAERVRTGAPAAPKRAVRLIEVVANDRLGGKVRVKCSPKDTVGDLKKLIAVQKGTKPEKIVLKKWYTIYKDHVSLEDYEIHDGMSLEMS